ncbi:hypothetical protein OH802_18010 [Nocardioides sp. NBC_00850]|jgi:hypothetical protein|uniref:hypothetical protein n=1 Tax=Nocardioides sp. NBC_00850 TaxID=2976001 RepID=UPI002FB64BB0|nr:hypothetical protein OH802_18010 [Nocardioides sp. NBC_00850]
MAAWLLIVAGVVALVVVVVVVAVVALIAALSGRAERTNIQHNVGDIDPGI